jgi:drug/metabolite transporter (DMT)-like permease
MNSARVWLPAIAAVTGSVMVGVMVGFMPLLARRLYAAGVDPASMLLWRYVIALPALLIAAAAIRLNLFVAWRRGAWKIALVGATLGVGQTITFWESIKTLDTSLAVLLFYTYPALMLVLDRVLFKRPVRPGAALCVMVILAGAAFIAVPGLRSGTIDLRGLAWAIPSPLIYVFYLAANFSAAAPATAADRRDLPLSRDGSDFAAIDLVTGLDVPQTADAWLLMVIAGLGPGALTAFYIGASAPLIFDRAAAGIQNNGSANPRLP